MRDKNFLNLGAGAGGKFCELDLGPQLDFVKNLTQARIRDIGALRPHQPRQRLHLGHRQAACEQPVAQFVKPVEDIAPALVGLTPGSLIIGGVHRLGRQQRVDRPDRVASTDGTGAGRLIKVTLEFSRARSTGLLSAASARCRANGSRPVNLHPLFPASFGAVRIALLLPRLRFHAALTDYGPYVQAMPGGGKSEALRRGRQVLPPDGKKVLREPARPPLPTH
jgi:hypothetical protein